MPLPTPNEGESRDEFMGRCMGDDQALADFPDEEQRTAVCSRQWTEKSVGATEEPEPEPEAGERSVESKHISCPIEVRQIDRKARTAVFAINTDTVDRDGDVVLPSGARLKNYKTNPVVLFGHDYNSLPVARAMWTKKAKEEGRTVLLSKAEFHEHTELARDVFNLVADGFLNTASVGFFPEPLMGRAPTDDELKARPDWKNAGRVFDDWELLEWSIVPVPSNPQALARAMMYKGVKLPKGMDLGTTDTETTSEDKVDHWNPDMPEVSAHEASFEPADMFDPDLFTRERIIEGARKYIHIEGRTKDVERPDGTVASGERRTYKIYYPTDFWNEQDAFLHAVDRNAAGFMAAHRRAHKIQSAPPPAPPAKVEKLEPVVPDIAPVQRLASDAEIRAIEEARSRGAIIY